MSPVELIEAILGETDSSVVSRARRLHDIGTSVTYPRGAKDRAIDAVVSLGSELQALKVEDLSPADVALRATLLGFIAKRGSPDKKGMT